MGSDNEYISFTDEEIASTIAHELVHSAGLGDANLTQLTTEDEQVNQSVPKDAPNLMNQKRTGRQGPFLTPQQQNKVSRTIEENKDVREQKQEQRGERNDE